MSFSQVFPFSPLCGLCTTRRVKVCKQTLNHTVCFIMFVSRTGGSIGPEAEQHTDCRK